MSWEQPWQEYLHHGNRQKLQTNTWLIALFTRSFWRRSLQCSHCGWNFRLTCLYLLHCECTMHQIQDWIIQSSKDFIHTNEECVECQNMSIFVFPLILKIHSESSSHTQMGWPWLIRGSALDTSVCHKSIKKNQKTSLSTSWLCDMYNKECRVFLLVKAMPVVLCTSNRVTAPCACLYALFYFWKASC